MVTKSAKTSRSAKPRRFPELKPIPKDRSARYIEIIEAATERFYGDLPALESAIGFLFMGHYFGWRVLHIIHSKSTVRNYERILGIDVKQEFPKDGEAAVRCNGWRMFEKVSNFWKAVNGEIKVEGDKFGVSPEMPMT